MKTSLKIIIVILFVCCLFAQPVLAAGLVKCGTHTNDPALSHPCTFSNLFEQIFKIISYLIGSATLLTIGYVLYGGVNMILARGNPTAVQAAKSTMFNAITGLIIVLLAYLIVSFVITLFSGGQFSFSTIPNILNIQ